jgi:hypothetical protein
MGEATCRRFRVRQQYPEVFGTIQGHDRISEEAEPDEADSCLES